jgi:hypothetical protein
MLLNAQHVLLGHLLQNSPESIEHHKRSTKTFNFILPNQSASDERRAAVLKVLWVGE